MTTHETADGIPSRDINRTLTPAEREMVRDALRLKRANLSAVSSVLGRSREATSVLGAIGSSRLLKQGLASSLGGTSSYSPPTLAITRRLDRSPVLGMLGARRSPVLDLVSAARLPSAFGVMGDPRKLFPSAYGVAGNDVRRFTKGLGAMAAMRTDLSGFVSSPTTLAALGVSPVTRLGWAAGMHDLPAIGVAASSLPMLKTSSMLRSAMGSLVSGDLVLPGSVLRGFVGVDGERAVRGVVGSLAGLKLRGGLLDDDARSRLLGLKVNLAAAAAISASPRRTATALGLGALTHEWPTAPHPEIDQDFSFDEAAADLAIDAHLMRSAIVEADPEALGRLSQSLMARLVRVLSLRNWPMERIWALIELINIVVSITGLNVLQVMNMLAEEDAPAPAITIEQTVEIDRSRDCSVNVGPAAKVGRLNVACDATVTEQLAMLGEQHERGDLTDEQFERAKELALRNGEIAAAGR